MCEKHFFIEKQHVLFGGNASTALQRSELAVTQKLCSIRGLKNCSTVVFVAAFPAIWSFVLLLLLFSFNIKSVCVWLYVCMCVLCALCVCLLEDMFTSVSACRCVYPKCVVGTVCLSVTSHIIMYAACVCSLDGLIKCLLSSQFSQFRVTIKVCVL